MRTYNMMEEPYLINQVKEAVCFISTDFSADLEKCKLLKNSANPIVVDYVLPDYNSCKSGHRRPHMPKKTGPATGRDDEQVMVLGNERFTVPELLFSPFDVGLKQAGIAETTMQSIMNVPERYRNVLLANIVVVGGNANIPGFLERFESELRPLAPVEAVVRIVKPPDPVTYTWQGGVALARNEVELQRRWVTRAEYLEYGSVWCVKKMAGEILGGGGGEVKESRSHKKRRVDDS